MMTEWWNRLRTQVGAIWSGMSQVQRWGVGVVTLLVLGGLLYLGWRSANPPLAAVFTRLSPSDAAEIVAVLRDSGVPYRLADNGTTVLVPEDQVYDVRLALAGQGLPRGGVVGFEIFLESALGATDFDRQVRYNMALQGELTRTIRELDGVQDARVHVVIPERRLFARDERQPTASVFLQLRPGAQLSASQIRGIAHLIARSVEGLEPENVTIVDSRGQVLSDGLRPAGIEGLDGASVAARLDLQRAYERELEQRVQSMLETVYGPGRAIVRVNAVINFDRAEEREDRYEPILRDTGLVRSSQILEEQATGPAAAGGVVGVDANIPGYEAVVGQAGSFSRREEILNYELNRVERVRVQAPGGVQRLSVAVWIDADLSASETRRVQELVAASLGVDPTRGDTVIVDSMPFAAAAALPVLAADAVPAPVVPPWMVAVVAAAVLVAMILLVARRRPAPTRPAIDLTVGPEVPAVPDAPPAVPERQRLRERIADLVKDNPREAAQLVKVWLAED